MVKKPIYVWIYDRKKKKAPLRERIDERAPERIQKQRKQIKIKASKRTRLSGSLRRKSANRWKWAYFNTRVKLSSDFSGL